MLFLGFITATDYNCTLLIILLETEEREFIYAMKDKKTLNRLKTRLN